MGTAPTMPGGRQKLYAVQHVVSTPNSWSTTMNCDSYSIGAKESDGMPSTDISRASVRIKQGGTNTTQTEYSTLKRIKQGGTNTTQTEYSTLKGGIVTGYSDGMEYTPKQECWVRGVSGSKFPTGEIHHLQAGSPQAWSWADAQEFYVFYPLS